MEDNRVRVPHPHSAAPAQPRFCLRGETHVLAVADQVSEALAPAGVVHAVVMLDQLGLSQGDHIAVEQVDQGRASAGVCPVSQPVVDAPLGIALRRDVDNVDGGARLPEKTAGDDERVRHGPICHPVGIPGEIDGTVLPRQLDHGFGENGIAAGIVRGFSAVVAHSDAGQAHCHDLDPLAQGGGGHGIGFESSL